MAEDPRLPGVETGTDVDPIVCHVDADCFYAACERLREPALRGEPLVVGMGYEPGDSVGAVATASYEAREYGVESAMAISQALEKLPRRVDAETDPDVDPDETGVYRPVDMEYYESVSEDVQAILHDCADVVREVSIDEAYLDVTERTDWTVAEGFARHIKERIQREVGVTVSIGVAPTMSAAKIASDFDKPNGLTVVEPGEVREFLAPLDVSEIHGVGPVTARRLREMGLETAGDVAAADPDRLVEEFGERGRELYDYSRGDDDRRVTPRDLPKSFSRESAFGSPVTDWERKQETLETLAEAVADRATREGALYRTVGVKAVTPPYDVNTRERSLSGPVDDPELVVDIATDLFREFDDARIRKLGVKVANLEFDAADQAQLDGWETSDAATGSGGTGSGSTTARRQDGGTVQESTGDPSETDEAGDSRRTADAAESNPESESDPSGHATIESFASTTSPLEEPDQDESSPQATSGSDGPTAPAAEGNARLTAFDSAPSPPADRSAESDGTRPGFEPSDGGARSIHPDQTTLRAFRDVEEP